MNNRGGKIHDGMDVNFDMKGELPSILRSTLEKHRAAEADEEEALGGVRTRSEIMLPVLCWPLIAHVLERRFCSWGLVACSV